MGTPIGPPTYGNNCDKCTPGTWAPGETPDQIQAFFLGVSACPGSSGPPAGTYTLNQHLGIPCRFEQPSLTHFIAWQVIPPVTQMNCVKIFSHWFSDQPAIVCHDSFTNDLLGCGAPLVIGFGGTCYVDLTPPATGPWTFCNDYEMVPVENTFYDRWLLPEAAPIESVFRIANVELDVNVLVKWQNQ